MTAETMTGPPSVADLIRLADEADEQQRERTEAEDAKRVLTHIADAHNAVARVLALSPTEADLRLTVTVDQERQLTSVYYASPDGMDGSIRFRYQPSRYLGADYGFDHAHIVVLRYCRECNGSVPRHDPQYRPSDLVSLGRLLRESDWPAKDDAGHEEHCSLAWHETQTDSSTDVARQPQDALTRIADALEAIADQRLS